MKFKIDDKVRIIARGQSPPIQGNDQLDFIGKIGLVERADEEEGYWVTIPDIEQGYDWFDEEALEAV